MDYSFALISDFEKGFLFEGFLLIRQVDVKTSGTTGKTYVDMTLGDKTGDIVSKWWDGSEAPAAVGEVLKVRGQVQEYMGRLQLRVERVRAAVPQDDVDMSSLVPSAPLDPQELLLEIQIAIDEIADEQLRRVVRTLYDEAGDKLLTAPAAQSFHHSVRSGLLWHVTTMLRAARALAAVYPQLDRDLLSAGVLIHDLSKLTEMNVTSIGVVDGYTTEGMLIGHIVAGVARIGEVGKALGCDPELIMLLQHMVLSHHGVPEYGSPRAPMFLEAEVLSHLDMLDARVYDITQALALAQPGTFTDRVRSLDGRRLYRRTAR